jgi:hypothetical protein
MTVEEQSRRGMLRATQRSWPRVLFMALASRMDPLASREKSEPTGELAAALHSTRRP